MDPRSLPYWARGKLPPPPPPGYGCQLELAPLGSALSPLRWRVNPGASHGEGVYKRKHRPRWPALPCLSSQRADRRSDGASPTLRHGSRRSGGATVPPLPPLHVSRRSGGVTVPPLPPVHVSRRSDGAAPHPTPSPPVPALYTQTRASRYTTHLTTHGPTLGIGFIADGTPKSGKRLPRPNSESVGLQSSSAGVRSRALVLLGSLHLELSSWRRGNHPPLQRLAPPPVPVDRVEVLFILPPTLKKQNTWEPPTPAAVRTVTCTRTGQREAPSGIRRDRWETTDPGV